MRYYILTSYLGISKQKYDPNVNKQMNTRMMKRNGPAKIQHIFYTLNTRIVPCIFLNKSNFLKPLLGLKQPATFRSSKRGTSSSLSAMSSSQISNVFTRGGTDCPLDRVRRAFVKALSVFLREKHTEAVQRKVCRTRDGHTGPVTIVTHSVLDARRTRDSA